MDDTSKMMVIDKGKMIEERKFSSNKTKDLKRKLSFMNKKINDLHHRRKFAYKNSVKVKKMIHNQVNQIVKCLRARERALLSDVDEAYVSLDANITEELSKLQSVYFHCQALFNNLSDFRGNSEIFSNLYSTLAEINCSEKSDIKPLEFNSDFEAMKIRANSYGYLDGDCVKKDDFVLVTDENDLDISGEPLIKEECFNAVATISNTNPGTSKNYLNKFSSEDSDIEETYQIINLIDKMQCNDLDDYAMAEEECVENCKGLEQKSADMLYERESTFAKMCVNTEQPHEVNARNINFNPEEEWKQIVELNKKLANFKEMTLKIDDQKEINPKIHKTVDEHKTAVKTNSKVKENEFIVLKEADNWLCKQNSAKDTTRKEKSFKNINIGANIPSPADLIQKAFEPYLLKGNTKYWLTSK